MPAYLIARVHVTDPEKYEGYKALSPGAVEKYGGRFLARGGNTETLEGEAETARIVIVEFADMATARTFYDSPEYTRAREARRDAADAQFIVTEGL